MKKVSFSRGFIRTLLAGLLAVSSLSVVPSIAYADVKTRWCGARYELDTATGLPYDVIFEPFRARGWCNWWEYDTCRWRASNNAHNCMQSHWNNRNDRHRPLECTWDDGRVDDYETDSLYEEMRINVCDQTDASYVAGWLKAVSYGDSGCDRQEHLGFIQFECP